MKRIEKMYEKKLQQQIEVDGKQGSIFQLHFVWFVSSTTLHTPLSSSLLSSIHLSHRIECPFGDGRIILSSRSVVQAFVVFVIDRFIIRLSKRSSDCELAEIHNSRIHVQRHRWSSLIKFTHSNTRAKNKTKGKKRRKKKCAENVKNEMKWEKWGEKAIVLCKWKKRYASICAWQIVDSQAIRRRANARNAMKIK